MKSWGSRLLEFALCVLAAALLLTWAWHLIRLLLPVIAAAVLLVAGISLVIRRRREW